VIDAAAITQNEIDVNAVDNGRGFVRKVEQFMDYDDWSRRADEFLSRLDAKYGPTPPTSCSELATRLNRLLGFLRERFADAWQTRELDALLEHVQMLAHETPLDAAAIDEADIEYYKIITNDERIREADRILADLDILDAVSHALKTLEEKKKSGLWTKDEDATYSVATEFRNKIMNELRESGIPLDD
jgi:hypothetical protein